MGTPSTKVSGWFRGPRTFAVAVGIVALLLTTSYTLTEAAPTVPRTGVLYGFNHHINHIIFLLQENRAYDNLYGEYCLVLGAYCPSTGIGIPAGKICVPVKLYNPRAGCVKPYNFTLAQETLPQDIVHDWNSTHTAMDGGKMDGFVYAEGVNFTMGHYNGTTVPVYWDLAEQYALGDNFFSAAASYSLPNHWYLVSNQAPNISYKFLTLVPGASVQGLHQYLNESNVTPSIEDELAKSKTVSWNYFDFKLPPYQMAIQPAITSQAYSYWLPLAARNVSYRYPDAGHIVNRVDFFSDAANGTLPNISWIIPPVADSDHPPQNLTYGQSFVASVVDALEKSPDWNSTALFVSWDEYGGFYDHVRPPTVSGTGYGIRVPLLIVSPWVKQGYIDSAQLSFTSVLSLMEERFGLKCLGGIDCNSTLPLQPFSFTGGPRAPIFIPPFGNASYPMPLQSSGSLPYYGPGSAAPTPPPSSTSWVPPPGFDWS